MSVGLGEVEARSALAQAARQERLTPRQLRSSVQALALIVSQLDLVDIDDALVKRAGDLAEKQELPAYDAIHVAAALRVADEDLVVVAGDRALLDAASAVGLAVAPTR